MGLTKSEIFNTSQNEIAGIAKVLGHPARIAILEHIIRTETCICGDLVNEIGLAQPTISQHLKELKNAGLIKGEIEGKKVCYCIEPEMWNKAKQLFDSFFSSSLPPESDCC